MKQPSTIEDEVSKTLETLARIGRVRANPYMADKVMRRLAEGKRSRVGAVSPGVRYALAGLLILVVLNVFSVVELGARGGSSQSALSNQAHSLAMEYQMMAHGYQY